MENNISFLFLVILLSSLVSTFGWIYRKKFLQVLSPVNLVFISSAIFTIISFIAFMILGKNSVVEESKKLSWYWVPLIILAILSVIMGLFINRVISKHDLTVFVPTRYVAIQILIILASVLILKERPNKITWIALTLFVLGFITMIFAQYKNKVE